MGVGKEGSRERYEGLFKKDSLNLLLAFLGDQKSDVNLLSLHLISARRRELIELISTKISRFSLVAHSHREFGLALLPSAYHGTSLGLNREKSPRKEVTENGKIANKAVSKGNSCRACHPRAVCMPKDHPI
ncbi:hypothetical protein VNO77_22500 [Canavalia gladiata]|uniref:Uncharacterized protein n=1 Tax=Canavalia gladiata TaxID=3824 RepID=A0AAN9L2Q2_CANGL